MSLQTRLAALIAAIGADTKALQARTSGYFGDGSDGPWAVLATPANSMANPTAEVDTTGWAPFITNGSVGAISRVSDSGAGSGSFAFELTGTTTGAAVMLQYPGGLASWVGNAQNVVAGQMVDFSANVKAQAGAPTSIKLTTRFLDAAGALLPGGEVDVPGAIQNAPTVGTWYSLSGSVQAPPGAVYAGVEAFATLPSAGTYTMRTDNLAARPLMPGSTRSGSVYTLTRDVYFTNLTVNAGVTINTRGYRIFCTGTLSGSGTIASNGGDGGTPTSGASSGHGAVLGGMSAGTGGAINGNGNPPGTTSWSLGNGGNAGSGGASGARTGGNPASVATPTGGVRRTAPELVTATVTDVLVSGTEGIGGGGGGGGGAGSTTAVGGGGGAGGGLLIVGTRYFSGTLVLQAKGGNGGQGGTNAGGGGGGGGGAIHLLYFDKSAWTGTTNVAGGSAGAANGTGAAGSAGSAGKVIQLAI